MDVCVVDLEDNALDREATHVVAEFCFERFAEINPQSDNKYLNLISDFSLPEHPFDFARWFVMCDYLAEVMDEPDLAHKIAVRLRAIEKYVAG